MSDYDLANLIMLENKRKETGRIKRLSGLVTSWDSKNHSAKVMLQPEGVETSWLPVLAHHIGNGWGVLVGLTPGDGKITGDQVEIDFPDGDINQPRVTLRVHSDTDRPPPVESGEILIKHQKGGSLFADKNGNITWTGGKGQADQNQDQPPPTAVSAPGAKGSGLDPQTQDVASGQTITTDTQGNITHKGTKGQTTVFDPAGQMIHTGTKGQTFAFDNNGNMTHTGVKGQTVIVDSTGNIKLDAKNTSDATKGDIIATAVNNISHTAGGSLTHIAQTIADTATNITHNGNTLVTGTLSVSQMISANGGIGGLGGLGNFANDAAAAAGGVAIGQIYRNASALLIRVT